MDYKFNSTYTPIEVQGEVNEQPSETIPDQNLSVSEILRRYASGLPLSDSQRVPLYETEETPDLLDGINPLTLDISEREAMKRNNDENIRKLKKKLENEQQVRDTKPDKPPTAE